MLITKFNRIIRNRVLWGIYAIVVSVSFVGMFTQKGGCISSQQDSGSAGEINGRKVSPGEFQREKSHVYLWLRMITGRNITPSAETDEEMQKQTWRRIAEMDAAKSLGFDTSDKEVVAAIQNDPMFAVEGRFSKARYNAFVQNFLGSMNAGSGTFEEYLREELTLEKIRRMVAAAVWIAPSEFEQRLRELTDSFTVQYVILNAKEATKDVTVATEAAKAAFEKDPKSFMIPEMARVSYVTFPLADFSTNIVVDASEVTNYYNEHIDRYTTTNVEGLTTWVEIDKVTPEIEKTLAHEITITRAKDAATRFVDRLIPNRDGKALPFEDAAAADNRSVATTALFGAMEHMTNLDVGLEFNEAAFALSVNPEEYFSEPVEGKKAFYVLALKEKTEHRQPEFDEVKDRAMSVALEEAKRTALTENALEAHRTLEEAVAAGDTFKNAAAKLKMEVKNTEPFTAYTAPELLDSPSTISAVVTRQQGELTGVLPTKDGVLIAFVEKRVASDASAADPVRNQLRQTLNRRYSRILLTDWERGLYNAPATKKADRASSGSAPVPNRADDTPPVVD